MPTVQVEHHSTTIHHLLFTIHQQFVAQRAGAEVLEPGDVLGDHVELDDVAARLRGRARAYLDSQHQDLHAVLVDLGLAK